MIARVSFFFPFYAVERSGSEGGVGKKKGPSFFFLLRRKKERKSMPLSRAVVSNTHEISFCLFLDTTVEIDARSLHRRGQRRIGAGGKPRCREDLARRSGTRNARALVSFSRRRMLFEEKKILTARSFQGVVSSFSGSRALSTMSSRMCAGSWCHSGGDETGSSEETRRSSTVAGAKSSSSSSSSTTTSSSSSSTSG